MRATQSGEQSRAETRPDDGVRRYTRLQTVRDQGNPGGARICRTEHNEWTM